MRFFIATTLVLAALSSRTASCQPAFGVTITEPGFKEVAAVIQDVANGVGTVNVPDYSTTVKVDVIGEVTLDLTNIVFSGLHLSTSNIGLNAPSTMNIGLSGLTAQISLDYRYRKVHWPHVSDHGSITVDPEGGQIKISVGLENNNGVPGTVALSDSASFSDFKIHFDGRVSWLYNLLVDLFKHDIGDAVSKALSGAISKAVDTSLNNALSKIPTSIKLGGGKSEMLINTSLALIQAQPSYLNIFDEFAVTDAMTSEACPYSRRPLPPFTPKAVNSELQLILGDTILSCPLWVQYANNALDFVLEPSMSPSVLNTKFWSPFIPPLAAKYPDRPISIAVSLHEAPTISSSAAAGVVANVSLALDFSVVTTSNTSVHALTLGADIVAGLDVYVNSTSGLPTIMLTISDLSLDFSVIQSSVGTISLSLLQGIVSIALPIVKSTIDKKLASFGIPLPTLDGFAITGPAVEYQDGFFAITSNFTIGPA